MKKIDWMQGLSYTAFQLGLPKGYTINIIVGVHRSGKITVYESVSKFIGTMEDLFKGTLDLDDRFYKKINGIIKKRKTV